MLDDNLGLWVLIYPLVTLTLPILYPQATDLDLAYRRRLESNQIRSYFYGGPALSQGQLSPFTIVVKFEDLTIYRIGDG